MSDKELLKQEKIYLIPDGLFGYTAYPVGIFVGDKFIPFDEAVAVTPEQYLSLKEQRYCWRNNELIPYIKPLDILTAEEIIKTYKELDTQEQEAQAYLETKDYISSKVANAILLNDPSLLEQLREEYAEQLIKIEEARKKINEVRKQRNDMYNSYMSAQNLLNSHH